MKRMNAASQQQEQQGDASRSKLHPRMKKEMVKAASNRFARSMRLHVFQKDMEMERQDCTWTYKHALI